MKKIPLLLAAGAIVALTSTGASANLITNGGFSLGTDGLTGWTAVGDVNISPGVIVEAGVANLGKTGTPGTSTLSQTFNLTNANLTGSFDATWKNSAPTAEDFFSVSLTYKTTVGPGTEATVSLGPVGSNSVLFNNLYQPTGSFTLADFMAGDATLTFTLDENNRSNGTFVGIDNVELNAVPLPAAAWLFGSALLGLGMIKRRKA